MEQVISSTGKKDIGVANRRKFITKLTWLIAGGMFVDGFVLGYVGMVMPAITQELNLSLTWQGLIGAAALIGIFFGSPLGGWLADRIGRRPMFTLDLMLFLVCSIAQFFVSDVWSLFIVRFLMGVAIGMEYSVGWPMLSEFAPARSRGKLLALQEVGWYVGFLASYSIGYVLTIIWPVHWNIILGLSTIPTLIVLLLRIGTPESPRWLMSKGRKEEAVKIASEYMEEEEQRDILNQKPVAVDKHHGLMELFTAKNIKITIFVSVFYFCSVTPYFAIGSFVPMVLEKLGLHDGFTGGLFLNIFAVAGVVFTAMLVEKMGRRKLGIPPFFICAVAFVLIGLYAEGSPTLVLICFLVFYFANTIPTALTGVYPGEVFPTEVRGIGIGFVTAVSRIGAAAGTFLLPLGIAAYGAEMMVYIAAIVCVVGGVVSYYLAPETKGKALSETA
ncbi:MFS transporter [Acinetobacter baumannii]